MVDLNNQNRFEISQEEIDVLLKIIQQDGTCEWAKSEDCKKCPISRYKVTENGKLMSCMDIVLGDTGLTCDLTQEEVDEKFKQMAVKILMNHIVDEILT